jgi:predicted GNAT family acetyltransferase
MRIERSDSAAAFLAATITYRARDPIRTNVIGSVATSVASDARQYDEYWWWTVLDDKDEVVGAALRTAPFGLHLVPMPDVEIAPLVDAVAREDPSFPWLAGRESLVTTFFSQYRAVSTRTFQRGRTSLLYELGDLVTPVVEGTYRVATMDDVELVAQWTDDFHYFIDGARREPDERDRMFLIERIAAGSMKLWCVGPVVVAMAGHAEPVATPSGLVTRVGPVFTPAENRGRGFGSAVTASLSAELVRGGSRVMLYADADNPTSNGVYQRLGYRLLDEVVQYDEVAAPS